MNYQDKRELATARPGAKLIDYTLDTGSRGFERYILLWELIIIRSHSFVAKSSSIQH